MCCRQINSKWCQHGEPVVPVSKDDVTYDDCDGGKGSKTQLRGKLLSPVEDSSLVFASSDEVLKWRAFTTPIGELARCNPSTCPYKGNCIGKMAIDDMMGIKEAFWGKIDEDTPTRSTRRLMILKILQSSIRRSTKTFEFVCGNKEHSNTVICEAAYLIALGLSNNPNSSRAPSQWINLKKWVMNGYDLDSTMKYSYAKITEQPSNSKIVKEKRALKFEDAVAFIYYFAKEYGDRVAGSDTGNNILHCNITTICYVYSKSRYSHSPVY